MKDEGDLAGLAKWGTSDDLRDTTRAVYHEQHKRIAADELAMERFIGMFPAEYFSLGGEWFLQKKILDAGCGDTAKLLIGLHRLGATDLHGLDLGTEFTSVAAASLLRHGVPEETFELISGSVTELPYKDETFDFVACHGVLLHLNNLDEVDGAFQELARVTRPGGYLYTVYGVVGGLWEDAIFPALRRHYRSDAAFKSFIDSVAPEDVHSAIEAALQGIADHTGEAYDLSPLKELIDVDLVVFWQNVIQAPVRLRVDEPFILERYTRYGFEKARRLKRYVRRKNLRKFLAPFHYGVDHPLRPILYGSGNLEFIARKQQT